MQNLAAIQVPKTPIEFRNLKAFDSYQKNKEKHFQVFLRFSYNDEIVPVALCGVGRAREALWFDFNLKSSN
jgi:hypothetical protein